jgi:hypothetical protein
VTTPILDADDFDSIVARASTEAASRRVVASAAGKTAAAGEQFPGMISREIRL